MSEQYKLAPKASHLSQLILATLPLFAVLLYFLYVAYQRPSMTYYNLPDDVDDDRTINDMIAADGKLIRMMNIVYTFLGFLLFWSVACVYTWIYVPKRRMLILSYEKEGRTVLGDVKYLPRKGVRYVCGLCKRFSPEYAAVTYLHHPEATIAEPSPQSAEELQKQAKLNRKSSSAKLDPDKSYLITKRVRTYQPYTRERVPILVLPSLPKSGQPKTDVTIDVASFTTEASGYNGTRDRTGGIVIVMTFWVVFTLLGSAYVVYQMGRLVPLDADAQYDGTANDAAWARKFWLVFVCGIVPLCAFGGNHFRWVMYRRWMVKAGRYIEKDSADAGRVGIGLEYEDEEPGCDGGMCAATLCAPHHGADDESVAAVRSTAGDGESNSPYVPMV